MQEVTEDRYLGDILSSDGKNTKCIKERISRRVGIQNQILNLLEMISFGPFYFEIAVLFRNSMLIPGTLTNANTEIQEFDKMDKQTIGSACNYSI